MSIPWDISRLSIIFENSFWSFSYEKGTFKITTPAGDELFYQAAGKQDRDGWAHAVGAVIRSLSGSKQVCHLTTSNNRIEVFYLFNCSHVEVIYAEEKNLKNANYCSYRLTLNNLFSSFDLPGNCVSNLCFGICNIKLQLFVGFFVAFLCFVLNSFRIQNNQFHSQLSEPQQMSGTCVHGLLQLWQSFSKNLPCCPKFVLIISTIIWVHVCVFYKHSYYSEILGAMQDPDAGVSLGSHVRNGAVHKNCFTGKTKPLFIFYFKQITHEILNM